MGRRRKILLGVLGAHVVLGGALAWLIHNWGRPLPVVYRRLEVVPADAESGRSITYQRLAAPEGAPKRYITLDTNNDGTVDLVLTEGGRASSFVPPRADDTEARWLVLCLDGVPYDEFRALWEEGHFREFHRPAPVIAPFPSASAVALTALFHTGTVAGYEDGYFDRAHNELAGGTLKTSRQADIPYARVLDYDLPGWSRGLAYVLPVKAYRADLGRLKKRFLESPEKVFVAHIASTDSLHHVRSRAETRELLLEVDSLLRELYLDAGGALRITLFSDHGNSNAQGRMVPLAAHLEARGWRPANRLEQPRDVVAPAYGLLGMLVAYCAPEERAALARDLASMEGVALAVHAEGNSAVIESAEGRARLEWKPDGGAYRYAAESGDPLGLSDILATLNQGGKVDAEGWVADADLFAATREHVYPDVARRLWHWATNHVENRADVVVSLKPGYHYGSAAFGRIVTLRGTHGAADREQSLGFATSTDGPLAGPVRAGELLPANLGKPK
ncbi:MAG: hypothetical protein L0212_03705 [Acidobacteria bacterium]|nr:hypothetical protein [Acidobacteriota bacterium]